MSNSQSSYKTYYKDELSKLPASTLTNTITNVVDRSYLENAQKDLLSGKLSQDEYNVIYNDYRKLRSIQEDSVKQMNSAMRGYANQLIAGEINRDEYNKLYKERQNYLSSLAEEYYNPRLGITEMVKPEDVKRFTEDGWVKYGSQEYINAINQSVADDPSNAEWAVEMGIVPNYAKYSTSNPYYDALNRKLGKNTQSNILGNMLQSNLYNQGNPNVISLNPNNPNGEKIYRTQNGAIYEVNGQRMEITEDEFIKFMTEYLGF